MPTQTTFVPELPVPASTSRPCAYQRQPTEPQREPRRLTVCSSVINKGTLRMEFQAGSYSTTRIARRARAASRPSTGHC
jgi:hypothetical protein